MLREYEVYGIFSGLLIGFVLSLVLMWADSGLLVYVLGMVIVSALLSLFAVPEVYRDFALPSIASFVSTMCLWLIISNYNVDAFWFYLVMIASLLFSLFWVIVAISDRNLPQYYGRL